MISSQVLQPLENAIAHCERIKVKQLNNVLSIIIRIVLTLSPPWKGLEDPQGPANLLIGGCMCIQEFYVNTPEWVTIIASGERNWEDQGTKEGERYIFTA